MPERPFTSKDAYEICLAPFLDAAWSREDARAADARAEAPRNGGVRWSGLSLAPACAARTADEIRREAEAALARREAFESSARGRFLQAVRALESSGHAAPAAQARAAYDRGFADPGRAACPAEIGVALSALARLDQPQAHAACVALSELLAGSLGLAAE
jgi:hypothetical protein